MRESPALEVIKGLVEEGSKVFYYDPFISKFIINGEKYKSLKELAALEIKEKDIIIITTDQSTIDYEMLADNAKAVFDSRNVI